MLKKVFIITAGLFCSLYVVAQTKNPSTSSSTANDEKVEEDIVFKEESFDFGTIEEGTLATHEFEFVNNGKTPIIISNVQASCGCTTPSWSKDPVAPGKKGFVKASFDSNRRPGVFNKSITITANTKTPVKVLYIKGTVTPKPETAPKLNLNKKKLDLGEIEKNQAITKKIEFTNQDSKNTLSILKVSSACNCVTYTVAKPAYKAGEKGMLELTYTPTQTGLSEEVVSIVVDDQDHPVMQVLLTAQVVDHRFQSVVKESSKKSPF
jgi:hypothetical protein